MTYGTEKMQCRKEERNLSMRKNIFKKIVASLSTAAMAVGMLAAMPAEEAKAAADGKETEIVLILSDNTGVGDVYLDIYDGANSQNADISSTATKDSTNVGWGRDMHVFTQDSTNKNIYRITTTGSLGDSEYCNMQFILAKDGSFVKGYKFYSQDQKDMFNSSDTIYITIDVTKDDWTSFSATTEDPTAAKPADIMAVIDAIGTVELTEESLKKIEAAETAYNTFEGDKTAVTNYETLTAARAKYNQLQAAEDAKNAGTLTVYVKSPGWDKMNVYGWDGADFGQWPGKTLTALTANEGWYSCSFEISKATNLIFNNAGAGEQTVDWTNVKAGTYWLVLSEKDGEGKYTVENVSTTAPTGWKDEAAQQVKNEAPTTTTTTGSNTSTKTGDAAPVIAMLAVAALAGAVVVASRKKTVSE